MVTVSSRGQMSIPADVRRQLKIDEGTKLLVISQGDNILLRKIDESTIENSLEDVHPSYRQHKVDVVSARTMT